MKSSSVKIVIKPRLGNGSTVNAESSKRPLPTHTPSSTDAGVDDDETEDDGNGVVDEGGDEGNGRDEEVESEGEPEVGEGGKTPAAKGKGKAKGKGRGLTTGTGTSTPRGTTRGRPRGGTGRGRSRGRGRGSGGLTIRLPRPAGEEGSGVEEATEGTPGPVVEEGAASEAGAEKEKPQKEAPLGGGKPFRKVQGKVYIIDGDEFVTDEDEKGNTKIDSHGNLLGGRRFKAATFTLPNRHPERVYMLAIDAARTSGFRDSLYYFRRNPLAYKLNATQPEKDHLIEIGKLGSHLKTRSVTLITAKSAFKLHGSKMVIDGKWVEDDYYEEKVIAEIAEKGLKPGDPVGELPDPQMYATETTTLSTAQAKADRSSGQSLGIYRAGGPTTIFGQSGWGPYSDGPLNAVRKSFLNREGLNEENWMFLAAQRSVEAGEEWGKGRREVLKAGGGLSDEGDGDGGGKGKESEVLGVNSKREGEDDLGGGMKRRKVGYEEGRLPFGVYEPHSGIVFYRSDTQPTASRWEPLPESGVKRRVLGGTKAGNGAWALAWVDTVMELPDDTIVDESGKKERERLMRLVG